METLVLKKRLDASKQITLDLPQFNEGDEIEIVVVINSLLKSKKGTKTIFDIAEWAQ